MCTLLEKEYYLASINEEQETVYRPVILEVTGYVEEGISRPVIVSVNREKKGFLKNTEMIDDSDDLELVLNYIGRRLGVRMAEEYRVFTKRYEKLGLLSIGVLQNSRDVFYEMRKVQFRILHLLQSGLIEKEDWIKKWMDITRYPAFPELEDNCEYQCKSKEDCYAAICLGLHFVKALYPNNGEARRIFFEEYLKMILFDVIIGQTDRTLDNYGIIFRTQEKTFELAPLFDNATLQKPYLGWDQYSLNGMVVERRILCEVLFEQFGDKARVLAEYILGIYEEQRKIFVQLAESWIENKSKDVLKTKLVQGYQLLKEFC